MGRLGLLTILLPYMVISIANALATLDPRYEEAAASLGAGPWRVFLRVSLPLCLPGIGAGCLLVFIQALGFYVTPALLGGPNDQMLAWFVGFYATRSVNWGLAAALSGRSASSSGPRAGVRSTSMLPAKKSVST